MKTGYGGSHLVKILAALFVASLAAAAAYVFMPGGLMSPWKAAIGDTFTDPASGLRLMVSNISEDGASNTVQITSYQDSGRPNLVIPDSVEFRGERFIVTEILGVLFASSKSLKSITVPGSMTYIAPGAFSRCGSLASVVIQEGVESIGASAFQGCISLVSMDIPDSVTSIGEKAFMNCKSLSNMIIPKGVTSIGDGAFSGCVSLTGVVIPDGVVSIGTSAFQGCASLARLNLPGSVTSIGDGAFMDCESLIGAAIPKEVTSVGNGMFSGCASLTDIIIPDGIASIGASAFQGCASLSMLDIPNSVTSIGERAFKDCKSLAAAAIPKGTTSIGDEAFSGCASLESMAIPGGVTDVGAGIFRGNNSTSIFCEAGETPKGWSPAWNDGAGDTYWNAGSGVIQDKNGILYVKFAYENKATVTGYIGNAITLVIPRTINLGEVQCEVAAIDPRAFARRGTLKSIFLPQGMKTAIDGAFGGGAGFLTVYGEIESQPEGLRRTTGGSASNAFAYWGVKGGKFAQDKNGIQYVKITDDSVMVARYVGKAASLSIPAETAIGGVSCSVDEIGDGAFFDSKSLTSVTIPQSVKFVGRAFNNNPQVMVIYCETRKEPENWSRNWNSEHPAYWNVKSGDIAHDGSGTYYLKVQNSKATLTRCTSAAASIEIPSEITINGGKIKVTDIGEGAFLGRSSLVNVVIPDTVRTIGNRAFWGCAALTGIEIPRRVTAIGDYAFYSCSSLPEVEIPNGASEIGKLAFAACASLRRASIPSSVRSIGEQAFAGCGSLSIYCEARSAPNGWSSNWNPDARPTVWNVSRRNLSSAGREEPDTIETAGSSSEYIPLGWESLMKRNDAYGRLRYRSWRRNPISTGR